MKKIILLGLFTFTTAQASDVFEASAEMTKFYYSNSSVEQAAEAVLWDKVLVKCQELGALPIAQVSVVTSQNQMAGYATGTFRCIRAGQE